MLMGRLLWLKWVMFFLLFMTFAFLDCIFVLWLWSETVGWLQKGIWNFLYLLQWAGQCLSVWSSCWLGISTQTVSYCLICYWMSGLPALSIKICIKLLVMSLFFHALHMCLTCFYFLFLHCIYIFKIWYNMKNIIKF